MPGGDVRSRVDVPLDAHDVRLLLEAYGYDRFWADAQAAGAASLIVADLPVESRARPLPRVHLVAPTTPDGADQARGRAHGRLALPRLAHRDDRRARPACLDATRRTSSSEPGRSPTSRCSRASASRRPSMRPPRARSPTAIVVGSRAVELAEARAARPRSGDYVASLRAALDAPLAELPQRAVFLHIAQRPTLGRGRTHPPPAFDGTGEVARAVCRRAVPIPCRIAPQGAADRATARHEPPVKRDAARRRLRAASPFRRGTPSRRWSYETTLTNSQFIAMSPGADDRAIRRRAPQSTVSVSAGRRRQPRPVAPVPAFTVSVPRPRRIQSRPVAAASDGVVAGATPEPIGCSPRRSRAGRCRPPEEEVGARRARSACRCRRGRGWMSRRLLPISVSSPTRALLHGSTTASGRVRRGLRRARNSPRASPGLITRAILPGAAIEDVRRAVVGARQTGRSRRRRRRMSAPSPGVDQVGRRRRRRGRRRRGRPRAMSRPLVARERVVPPLAHRRGRCRALAVTVSFPASAENLVALDRVTRRACRRPARR